MALTLTLLLISGISIATALFLRSLRLPGYQILSGLLIGILLGPTILGRIAPNQWESTFVGGLEARSALREMDRSHAAWVLASQTAGTSAEVIAGENIQHELAREELIELEAMHRQQHQIPWMVLTLIFAAIASVCASRNLNSQPMHASVSRGDGISSGVWFATVPLLGTLLLARWLGYSPLDPEILIVAAAVSVGPRALGSREINSSSSALLESEHWLPQAALTATCISALAVGYAAYSGANAGWLILAIILLSIPRTGWLAVHHTMRSIHIELIVIPSLAAMSIIMSEVRMDWMLIPVVVICILGGDGRWLGAVIGIRLRGGASMNQSFRVAFSLLETPIPQLTITAAATATGAIDGTWTVALVAGIAVIEISRPIRKWMERQLVSEAE